MYTVKVDYNECEDNRMRLEVCPEDVFEVVNSVIKVVREESCTGCNLCVENCPQGAISVD
jgi:NAD-dependent dihydropyrimidine dehydrogenase PreA subunit